MLKKILSTALASLLILTTCFAQTTSTKFTDTKPQSKLSLADFQNVEPVKVDFEKESYKLQTKKNNFSGKAKTALWVSLLAAGVITVVVLATGKDEENNRIFTLFNRNVASWRAVSAGLRLHSINKKQMERRIQFARSRYELNSAFRRFGYLPNCL